MKKALTLVLGLMFAAFFIGTAQASTIYQQLSNTTQQVSVSISPVLIGEFTVATSSPLAISCLESVSCSGIPYGLILFTNTSAYPAQIYLFIATSSDPANYSSSAVSAFEFETGDTNPADTQFIAPTLMSSDNGATQYQAGVQYYVFAQTGSGATGNLRSGSSGNFAGFLTDANPASVSIIPNVPGYTDVGVSTTSQAVNCDNNFATTTGLLNQTASDISVGFCNVGVFLFAPSLGAQIAFQGILPALGGKFPFSWFQAVPTTLQALTATSTDSFPKLTIGLGDLDIGSSTPMGNILPNLTFLSTTTVSTYLPDSIRISLIDLIAAGLWLGFIYEVYTTVRTRSFTHH